MLIKSRLMSTNLCGKNIYLIIFVIFIKITDNIGNTVFMQSLTTIEIITYMYIIFNSGRVFSYIPQIIAVFKEQNPVLAISLITWSFWTAANFTTALYATVVLPDVLLAAMSYGNTFCCAVVVLLVIYKRYKYNYWPKSKRNKFFAHIPVTLFTEVPNFDTEEIYHFFDVSDESEQNHTVTFSKKFNHEEIETFDSFLEMTKKAEENFNSETIEKLPNTFTSVIEDNFYPVKEVLPKLPIDFAKKKVRKNKETILIKVETQVGEVKQEVETPITEVHKPIILPVVDESTTVAILPFNITSSPASKRNRNSRKKK